MGKVETEMLQLKCSKVKVKKNPATFTKLSVKVNLIVLITLIIQYPIYGLPSRVLQWYVHVCGQPL